MHRALWALGLLTLLHDLPLVATAARRRDNVHRHRQAKLLDQRGEYEIVTPTRVDEFGKAYPSNLHFKRKKRSAHPNLWPLSPKTHYRLSAFGQHFLLNLTADSSFMAPLFTVSLLGEPGVHGANWYRDEEEGDMRHCFYRGQASASAEHTAVISLCSGMLGTFRSHDAAYFVEPLLSMDGKHFEEEHNKPHIIYRHSSQPKDFAEGAPTCDTAGHEKTDEKYGRRQMKDSILLDLEALKNSIVENHISEHTNKTEKENGTQSSHRRIKRFLSYPRYVEVMVVADNRMAEYHGANLQHYILTLMSIVASIYKDPSIGNLINIVIVKLVVVQNEQDGPSISYNAQTTLKNFCIWQQTQNHPDDNHHSHHDTAVLVTRQDICRAHNYCDTLGLAELGTVCESYRSCSISEDNGLSTAFTIAHELGHVYVSCKYFDIKCMNCL